MGVGVAALVIGAVVASAACGDRIASTPRATTDQSPLGLRAREVVGGLDRPVFVAFAPGDPDSVYVVGQAGTVGVVQDGVPRHRPLLDIRRLVRTSPKRAFASEQGLLSIAFAPHYASNGRFAVAYTGRDGALNVVEYTAVGARADPSSGRTLLRVPKREPEHNGGQVHYGPGGGLYVSVGDDDSFPSAAQRPGRLGRILVHRADDRWQPIAYGLRNPWRWSFDRANGDIWIGDVGESDWEEIDRVPSGSGLVNLGWDAYEGFEEYEGTNDHEPDGDGEVVAPLAVYDHEAGCSVVGGYVYRGKAIGELRGRYVYGDYCTGRVWSLDPADPGRVRLELVLGTTLASFGEDEAGELYLVSRTGRIFLLEPR